MFSFQTQLIWKKVSSFGYRDCVWHVSYQNIAAQLIYSLQHSHGAFLHRCPAKHAHTSPLLSPQSRFLIPSIILHFCLPASFFLTIHFGLMFCLLCSLCGRISPVTGIQHLLFCLPFVSHPSLWFCLALGAGCDSVKGEWALLCSTSPTLQL